MLGGICDFFSTMSIMFHRTDALKPPQRGSMVERIDGVLCDGSHSTVSHDNLEHVFGAGALDTAGFMASGSPSRSIGCRASFEMWSGFLVDIESFGGLTWVRVRDGHHGLWMTS